MRGVKQKGLDKVYIHQDLTPKQREQRAILMQELRQRQSAGEKDLILVGGKIVTRRARSSQVAANSDTLTDNRQSSRGNQSTNNQAAAAGHQARDSQSTDQVNQATTSDPTGKDSKRNTEPAAASNRITISATTTTESSQKTSC